MDLGARTERYEEQFQSKRSIERQAIRRGIQKRMSVWRERICNGCVTIILQLSRRFMEEAVIQISL